MVTVSLAAPVKDNHVQTILPCCQSTLPIHHLPLVPISLTSLQQFVNLAIHVNRHPPNGRLAQAEASAPVRIP